MCKLQEGIWVLENKVVRRRMESVIVKFAAPASRLLSELHLDAATSWPRLCTR